MQAITINFSENGSQINVETNEYDGVTITTNKIKPDTDAGEVQESSENIEGEDMK